MTNPEFMERLASAYPQHLDIGDGHFDFVQAQRDGTAAIYKGDREFLRIGDQAKIQTSLARHQQMQQFGFPVSNIISSGTQSIESGGEEKAYFTEESLGDERIGDVFRREFESTGEISDPTFDTFINITRRFAEAQFNTVSDEKDRESFTKGIRLEILCQEMPDIADELREAVVAIEEKLAVFPYALQHGDLKPYNLFPDGVIDFEDAFMGPIGFDVGSLPDYLDWFPASSDFEYYQKFRFSDDQKKRFLDTMDALYESKGMPKISDFVAEFTFLKGLSVTAGMDRVPKLQQWRFGHMKNALKNMGFLTEPD